MVEAMYDITASIVTYNTKREELEKVLKSFFNTGLDVRLHISDNSPENSLENELADILKSCGLEDRRENIEYVFNGVNGGYGWGHNRIINSGKCDSKYHLILNPDIYFGEGVLEKLYGYMEKNRDTGLIMPLVRYPDGEIQYLCKMIPTPLNLIFRRFLPFKGIREKMDYSYEMRWSGYGRIMEVPVLSGCFMFFRTEKLTELNGFDERYFMYLEDFDLSRRMNEICRTVFYPEAEIVHNHAKESYRSRKMTEIHIRSAIKYFNKWGWIFDRKRRKINRQIVEKFRNSQD